MQGKLNVIVSVVIPVYNSERYLRECLDSVLTQTFRNIELILVDDGSTDGSGVICDEYFARDHRVQVIHNSNYGANASRKAGVEVSSGEYICFVDSDDTIAPDFIECALNLVCQDVDIVSLGEDCDSVLTPVEFGGRLLHWNAVHLWSKLFSRHLLAGTDALDVPRDFKVAEDLISNVRVLKYMTGNVVTSSEKKYNYRISFGSVAHSFKITPEYDWKVLQEVTKAVEDTPLDLEKPFVNFRISILRHLICGRYKFDRQWAIELKKDSEGCQLDAMQKKVIKAIDMPLYRTVVRVIVIARKIKGKLARI